MLRCNSSQAIKLFDRADDDHWSTMFLDYHGIHPRGINEQAELVLRITRREVFHSFFLSRFGSYVHRVHYGYYVH